MKKRVLFFWGNHSLKNLIRPYGPPSPVRGRLRVVSPAPSEKGEREKIVH